MRVTENKENIITYVVGLKSHNYIFTVYNILIPNFVIQLK